MDDIVEQLTFERCQLQRPLGFLIEKEQTCNQHDAYQHQIPMAQQFHTNHSSDVPFVAKFLKDRSGGAATCVLEINGIGKIGNDADGIDDNVHPLCHLLPPVLFFPM